jgi:predicted permease
MTALKNASSRGIIASGRDRMRRVLVAFQIALSVMLVISASLSIRTVYNLTRVDVGFDRSRLVTFSMTLPMATSEPDTRARTYQRMLDRLRTVPGVQGATAMSGLPPNRPLNGVGARIENHIASTGEPFEVVDYLQDVMSDYFETMRVPIVAGRGFQQADATVPDGVAVINETFARRVWRGQDPIGHRIRRGGGPWLSIVGVAKDVKQGGIAHTTGTELYTFIDQRVDAPPTMNVVLRTSLALETLSRTLERVVADIDPTVPIVRLREMDAVFAESIRRPRLLAHLLGAFAGLALLLAAVGTYGVLSYLVAQRRVEIGVRMALGAKRSRVVAEIMRLALRPVLIGIVFGLCGTLGMGRLVGSLLFEVEPTDPTMLAAVVGIIGLVAVLACSLPAWRASRVSPMVALRCE